MYAILLFILICLLTYNIYNQSTTLHAIDNHTLEYFYNLHTKTLDSFFSIVTWMGSLWVIAPLFLAIIFLLFKQVLVGISLYLGFGFLGAISTTYGLKYLIAKQRPNLFEVIGELPKDPSFPSAHTTQIVIFCTLMILLINYFQPSYKFLLYFVLILMMVFVAISRMYLQVHFLSDVIAGALIALFWCYITYWLLSSKGLI